MSALTAGRVEMGAGRNAPLPYRLLSPLRAEDGTLFMPVARLEGQLDSLIISDSSPASAVNGAYIRDFHNIWRLAGSLE